MLNKKEAQLIVGVVGFVEDEDDKEDWLLVTEKSYINLQQ